MNKIVVLLLICFPVLCGCRDDPYTIKGLVPASGTVIYEGAPLAEAIVSFSPIDGQGMAGTAMTDAKGRFVLSTRKPIVIDFTAKTVSKTVP